GAGGFEKLRYEIKPWLHGDYEAFLQHARQAEVGMAVRARNVAPVGGAHEAADVVDFQPEEMADSVGEEHAGGGGRHGLISAACDDVGFAQDTGDQAVGFQVDIAPVHARPDAGAESLLHAVHLSDQGGEVRVTMGMGLSDVAGIAGELRGRIDQEGVALGGPRMLEDLVVQDGAVLVQGDDGVVRQVLLARAAGGEERELDLELGRASLEGTGGGELTPGAETARLAQAGELVG